MAVFNQAVVQGHPFDRSAVEAVLSRVRCKSCAVLGIGGKNTMQCLGKA